MVHAETGRDTIDLGADQPRMAMTPAVPRLHEIDRDGGRAGAPANGRQTPSASPSNDRHSDAAVLLVLGKHVPAATVRESPSLLDADRGTTGRTRREPGRDRESRSPRDGDRAFSCLRGLPSAMRRSRSRTRARNRSASRADPNRASFPPLPARPEGWEKATSRQAPRDRLRRRRQAEAAPGRPPPD